MHPHPLIHDQLARQRELELRHSQRHHASGTTSSRANLPLLFARRRRATSTPGRHSSSASRPPCATWHAATGSARRDIDDVVQTVWASAFSHIEGLREPEAVAGWLCVITRREAIRLLERRRREVLVDEIVSPEGQDLVTPETALLASEQREAVIAAVGRLAGRSAGRRGCPHARRRLELHGVSNTLGLPIGSIGPTPASVPSPDSGATVGSPRPSPARPRAAELTDPRRERDAMSVIANARLAPRWPQIELSSRVPCSARTGDLVACEWELRNHGVTEIVVSFYIVARQATLAVRRLPERPGPPRPLPRKRRTRDRDGRGGDHLGAARAPRAGLLPRPGCPRHAGRDDRAIRHRASSEAGSCREVNALAIARAI